MRLKITNNQTGDESVFDACVRDVLIGSNPDCDIVLEGADVLGQHFRLIHASNHLFLKRNKNENGVIPPVYRTELSEHRTNYHWEGDEMRIDSTPVQIGQYTICRF
jgi:hypothetical protein